jgi:hypothetical protein
MKLVEQMDTTMVVSGQEVAVRTLRLDPMDWERVTAIGRPSRKYPGGIRIRQPHSRESINWSLKEHVESDVELYQGIGEIVRVWVMVILEDPEEVLTHVELVGDNWTLESFVVQGHQEGVISVEG